MAIEILFSTPSFPASIILCIHPLYINYSPWSPQIRFLFNIPPSSLLFLPHTPARRLPSFPVFFFLPLSSSSHTPVPLLPPFPSLAGARSCSSGLGVAAEAHARRGGSPSPSTLAADRHGFLCAALASPLSPAALSLSLSCSRRGRTAGVRAPHHVGRCRSPHRALNLASVGRYGMVLFLFSVPAADDFTPNPYCSMR